MASTAENLLKMQLKFEANIFSLFFFGAIKQANNHVSKRFFYCDLSTQALGHFELKLRI